MKMRFSLRAILLLIAGFALHANAQQKHLSFNAVAQNVDGLPKKVSIIGVIDINVNEDGKEGPGATQLGTKLAEAGWDIVALSEDFNFHSELTAPLNAYYYVGTHGGSISASLDNNTDGLGLLLAKRPGAGFANEDMITWNQHNGETDQGADGLVDKGFRYYTVTLSEGFVVDVYVLHMDAEDGEKDINARTSQLQQLATYIKGHNNNRPILIIGDTNCRYTRDTLKENLIDAINAVSGMTIKDAWIELMRGGEYPAVGDPALMIDKWGEQKGEVVDKIFYINIEGAPLQIAANTYERKEGGRDVWASDHSPVVVNFTLTNANGTDTPGADKWTVDVPTITETTIQGCTPESGKTYYFMNVETKQYLKGGGTWGAHADEGNAGSPVTLVVSEGKYKLSTFEGTRQVSPVTDTFMDDEGSSYAWTFEVADAVNNYYYVKCDAGVLTSESDQVYCRALASTKRQQWILLDDAKMKEEMLRATTSFDCTPLIKTADFDRKDYWDPSKEESMFRKYWTGASSYTDCQAVWTWEALITNYCVAYAGTDEHTLSQTLSSMPAGNYVFSYEAFYRSEKSITPTISFDGTSNNIAENPNTSYKDWGGAAVVFRDNDTYRGTISKNVTSEKDITISVNKPSVSSGESWLAIDKFQLHYIGGDPTLEPRKTVADKINDTWTLVSAMSDAGQNAYDITNALERYNNGYVKTVDDVAIVCAMIDEAYNNAVSANNQAVVNNVAQNGGGDISALITNPSFETGDLTGWTIKKPTADTGVYPNSNRTYTTSGIDGTYLFNTWDGDPNSSASYIKQEIVGLPTGLYKLEAKVTSHAGRTIFLTGNDAYAGVVAGDNGVFNDVELLFLVEGGETTIGAVGASAIDGNFAYFMPASGGYFKADNFRLAYVTDLGNGRLKLAIDKANAEAAKFDEYGKAAFDISSYETMYANKSVSGDGKNEVKAISDMLMAAAKVQKTVNVDMTCAITNPSFESGDMTGWTTTNNYDTKVARQAAENYAAAGCDGAYLFNSWSDDVANNPVAPVKQTVNGIPNGRYRLTAMMASGNGVKLYVAGNSTVGAVVNATGNTVMHTVSVEFDVTDHKAEIAAFAGKLDGTVDATNGGDWYKADDFHLTFLGHDLVLEETATTASVPEDYYTSVTVNRTISANVWSTLVLPFDMAIPSNLTVKEFAGDALDGGYVTLSLADAASIEAGVPYLVKPKASENVTAITATNVDVTAALQPVNLNYASVHGVYAYGNIPTDAYFISQNKWWHAVDNSNKIKAFRAYITMDNAAGINGLLLDIDGDVTAIQSAVTEGKATVVGIFTPDGCRADALRKGINFLKMSDGSTQKVLVK